MRVLSVDRTYVGLVTRGRRYYRTAFNRVTQERQQLYLDEWFAPSRTLRPGALIIHVSVTSCHVHAYCLDPIALQ